MSFNNLLNYEQKQNKEKKKKELVSFRGILQSEDALFKVICSLLELNSSIVDRHLNIVLLLFKLLIDSVIAASTSKEEA